MTEKMILGHDAMDETHAASLRLLDHVKNAQGNAFLEAFSVWIEHTEAHFAMEEALMRSHAFYGLQEHCDEHRKLLEEMRYFFEKASRRTAFGRAYIDEYAFEKFRRHVINIDAQLAMFLATRQADAEPERV